MALMIFYNIIPLACLCPVLMYLYMRNRSLSPGGLVIGLYVFSFSGALFIDHSTEWYSVEASLYLGISLLLFVSPLVVHASSAKTNIKIGRPELILPFSRALVAFGLISIYNFILQFNNILDNIFTPTAFRTDKIFGIIENDLGPIQYMALVGTNLFSLHLAFFFLGLIAYPKKKLMLFLLFLSSLSYPLTALAVDLSRGALVIWMIMSGLIYLSFYPYIKTNIRIKINILLGVVLLTILILFAILTIGRGSISGDVSMYLVDYFFHQFGNFNRFYNTIANQPNDISYIFPILANEHLSVAEETEKLASLFGFDLNVFATLIGSLIIKFQPLLVFSIAVVFAASFGLLILLSRNGFGTLLLVFFICEVLSWGIFYYNYNWNISNIIFLLYLMLCSLFNPRARKNSLIFKPYIDKNIISSRPQHA